MKSLRPIHATLLVLLFAAGVLLADYALDGGFSHAGYERVSPDTQGRVMLDIREIPNSGVKFYRFLNYGNQEVKFFVGRDASGHVAAAFDANEVCFKTKRGYRHEGDWVVCNKCDKSFRLSEISKGGGCSPVPLEHRLDGETLVLLEDDILAGWRYFR